MLIGAGAYHKGSLFMNGYDSNQSTVFGPI